jgi:deoxyribose-phosphate aldolase
MRDEEDRLKGNAAVDAGSLDTAGLLDLIDYTLLKPESTVEEYSIFVNLAKKWGFRNVFVPPVYVPLAVGLLSATEVGVGVPVGFPFGYSVPEAKVTEALNALEDGAREVDMVMNVSAAVSGMWDVVEEDMATVAAAVRDWERLTRKGRVPVKVILETPYLDDAAKRRACEVAMEAGIDFVKTATGLAGAGATQEDVSLMRSVVGDDLGVKAAGGIRTWQDARLMIEAGANRIGTSAGLEIIEDFIRAGK